jgi:hypothetical protein
MDVHIYIRIIQNNHLCVKEFMMNDSTAFGEWKSTLLWRRMSHFDYDTLPMSVTERLHMGIHDTLATLCVTFSSTVD